MRESVALRPGRLESIVLRHEQHTVAMGWRFVLRTAMGHLTMTSCAGVQERDDLRKRTRQERLYQLRTGKSKSWVQLNRENPPLDA